MQTLERSPTTSSPAVTPPAEEPSRRQDVAAAGPLSAWERLATQGAQGREEEVIDASAIDVEVRLEGHPHKEPGAYDAITAAGAAAGAMAATAGAGAGATAANLVPLAGPVTGAAASGVIVNIALQEGAPVIKDKPLAAIAKARGPNVAGFTTSKVNVKTSKVQSKQIDMKVALSHDIEMAREYKGMQRAVLRDHEEGHVIIARQAAQRHLVTGLGGVLRTFPNFNQPMTEPLKAAVNEGATNFATEDETRGKAYDSVDYPRMDLGYEGAGKPLSALGVNGLVKALDGFNAQSSAADEARWTQLAMAIVTEQQGLSGEDLSRLQYNAELQGKVGQARDRLAAFQRTHASLGADAKAAVGSLGTALGAFHWSPPA